VFDALSLQRNDPPGKTTVSAEQELLRLSETNPEGLSTMDPIKDFNIRDLDMVTTIARKQSLEEQVANYSCLNCPKFTEHVSQSMFCHFRMSKQKLVFGFKNIL